MGAGGSPALSKYICMIEDILYCGKVVETGHLAIGYYCMIQGKHYLISDDAEILGSEYMDDYDECIVGFFKVDPSTITKFYRPQK